MNATLRLVEREAELSALDGALDAARNGDGSVLAIRGTAGVGKTSLARAAAQRSAALGMRVLDATGGRLEIDYPFGIARQLLERDVVTASPDEREHLFAGPARLGARALAEHDGDALLADPSSGLVHGLYWLVANYTALVGPVLLCVDDLQWCDLASLQFLAYLARRIGDLPVLLVVAARPDEHPGDRHAFEMLTETAPRTVLVPRPLTGAGVRAMLDTGETAVSTAISTALVERMQAETGGNPFLVNELARTLTSGSAGSEWADGPMPAPASVARAIEHRVRAAGSDAVALAGAVATLGDGCVLAEAAALAGLDADDAATAGSILLRADVLTFEHGVSFAHPLVRTAVEDGMTAPERSHWHSRAAQVLTERGADAERVAVQLMRTAPSGDREVSDLLAAAGRSALAKGAPQAAARYLQRALDEGPDPAALGAVRADLGTSLLVADRFEEAASVLRLAHADSADEAELVSRTVALWMALTGIGAPAVPEGVRLLESTIARVQDRESRMTLESEFVNVAFLDASRLRATWRRLEPFTDLRGESPAERRLLSMAAVKAQYSNDESAEVVADAARRSYRGGLLIDENPLDPTKWIWAVGALILTDQLGEAGTALQRGAESAAATGSLQTLLVVDDLRVLLWLRRGRVADAEAEARDALERLGDTTRTPVVRSLEIALVRWALLAMTALGRLDEADALLARHDLDGDLPPGPRQVRLHHERGMLRLAQRRPREALAEAHHLAEFHRAHGIESIVEAPWRMVAAQSLAALHDSLGAVEVAEEHLTLARRWGLPRDLGLALRVRGQVDPDPEQRVELLEEAVATLRRSPAHLDLAEAASALGGSLRRMGRRSDARPILDEALTLATDCGATALIERARDEIRLIGGGEARVRTSTGVGALTPGERRIARLAADGLSNRQIAQELFLSVRTAENTLRRVYQKLAITSRRELARAMGGAR